MLGKKDPAEKTRRRLVKEAESNLFRARLSQRTSSELRAAKDEVTKQETPLAELESRDAWLSADHRVFFDRVKLKGDEHALTADVTSRVEGSGRTLGVLVEAAAWSGTIEVHAGDVGNAHDFVRALNRQVAKLAAGEELFPADLAAAREAVAEVKAKLQANVNSAAAEVARLKAVNTRP